MAVALVGGTVVDLNPVRVEARDVVVEGGVVVERPPAPGDQRLDCTGAVVWPGLVCAHAHLHRSLARGIPPPVPLPKTFMDLVERLWGRLEMALDEQAVHLSVLAASMEALRAGTTTIFDHHASPRMVGGSLDVVAAALRQVGLRGALCYGASDRGGEAGGLEGVAESARFAAQVRSDRMLRGLVGLHAPYAVGTQTLRAAAEAARAHHTGVHLNVSEALGDEVHSATRYGMPPVSRLAKAGALGPLSLVVHAVHLDDAEVRELGRLDVPVVHCPRSNAAHAVGYQDPRRFRSPVALGTDGVDGDVVAEARAAHFMARAKYGPAESLDVLRLVQAGFVVAERHFGLPWGALRPGFAGDAVVTRYDAPTPLTERTAWAHLLHGPSPWPVRDVVVDGEVVLRGGEFTHVDEGAVKARCREAAARVWAVL